MHAAGAQTAVPDHSGQYPAADIAIGARVYSANCANCHGATGTGIAGVDLRHGPLPRAATDAALRAVVTKGLPGTTMPATRLEPSELTGLVAFVRSGFDAPLPATAMVGDAARGRLVFETTGRCLSCHRVHDTGSFLGPDLTDIGRLRTAAALQNSLLDPTGSMQPINRPVRAVTREGRVVEGRRLNEDLYTVQIITGDGRLVSLTKPELKAWTVSTTSTMPSYAGLLTPAELADVLGYLASLKGVRP